MMDENPLTMFLERLDADPEAAAIAYETLRMKLSRFAMWRGCPPSHADQIADEAIDRVMAKVAAGVEIRSVGAYAAEVLRFVWLEFSRKHREDPLEELLIEPSAAPAPQDAEDDRRLDCLKRCMGDLARDPSERTLILSYYDAEAGAKNKEHRRKLAADLGISAVNLKVKACRIRARLEQCINDCAAQ